MRKNLKGFTLIELLVVVAIIGILSSVVLASLNTARAKGVDAAIKQNLSQVRGQAELYYDINKDYGAVTAVANNNCQGLVGTMFSSLANPSSAPIITAAETARGGGVRAWCAVGTNRQSYAVALQLRSTTDSFCIDSAGRAAVIVGNAIGGGNAIAQCP